MIEIACLELTILHETCKIGWIFVLMLTRAVSFLDLVFNSHGSLALNDD